MAEWATFLAERRQTSIEELQELLRIPSISALPEHAGDVQRAAEWVAVRLEAAGLEDVAIMPTGGHPVVYGHWEHAPGKPTILIYGHFDVQPVDPIDLWTSGPFEAEIRDDRIYARGASDMKGNLVTTILAVQALLETTGVLPVNVKFLLEGQEEIGSPQLPTFIAEHRDLLACDLAISADGGQFSADQPSINVGLRGGCGVQIDVRGANSDLHSGLFGGVVQNPIHALVQILDSLRSAEGRILVDGFYDEVEPLSDADRAQIAAIPFDERAYREELGVPGLFGESGYTPLERAWARPTLEINGIWGGFQGEGVKTVLPNEAHAKITCRLVPWQEPSRIVELVIAHVEAHSPPGVIVTAQPLGFVAKPYLIPAQHPANQLAAEVLTEVYGKAPLYVRMGGSVPVCEIIQTHLGAYTVSLGFGLSDERYHAPNEFWRLSSFDRGQHSWTLLLQRLSEYSIG